jgi:hypothetical protein
MTQQDKAHYEKLRKIEASFQRWKHLLLWSGLAGVVIWPVMFIRLMGGMRDTSPEVFAVTLSFAIPSFYAISAGSGLAIGMAIKNWRGDPMRCLLLGLIEEKTKNEK